MGIVALMAVRNYVPGTWLTGWDNLHPEFNFKLNIYRSLFSVWQEYQGLGLLAGMAHASDLPHQLFLFLLSYIFPPSSLRYIFHFLMLLVGTWGVYAIIEGFFLSHLDEKIKKKAAFLGALFYLLNLGTVQYFFVPFEPYSTFWGLFPWELFVFFRLLQNPNRKNTIIFALVNVLAIPQAYVQTLFLVYFLCLGVISATDVLIHKSKARLHACLKMLLIIICINAFWLLPNIYFTLKDVSVTQQAMNNQMNNERFFQENKKRGTIQDFAVLKEFYFDFINSKDLGYMMQPWRDHYQSKVISGIGFLLFAIIMYGLLSRNKNNRYLWGIFLLSCLTFLTDTPLISDANNLIRSFPLVSQIFRNPFTKFIVPTIFVFSIFFAVGVAALMQKKAPHNNKNATNIFFLVLFTLILLMGYPVFKGHLFYVKSRLAIPDKYFKLFTYFDSKDRSARIMNLPQDSYWGWGGYKWGSIGSGFLWYGIEQPIMDRAFDVWGKSLEGYYWELNYALKKEDMQLFNSTLQKYQIKYIIFDDSYVPSDSMPYKFLLKQEEVMLLNNPAIQKKLDLDGLRVYEAINGIDLKNNIILIDKLPSVNNSQSFNDADIAFNTLGTYKGSRINNDVDYIFPFQTLFTNRPQIDSSVSIIEDDTSFKIVSNLPPGKYDVNIPSFINEKEGLLPVEIYAKKDRNSMTLVFKHIEPALFINNSRLDSNPSIVTINTQINDEASIMSVNNNGFFSLQNLTAQPSLIGNVYLKKGQITNEIRIFSQDKESQRDLKSSDFGPQELCDSKLRDNSLTAPKTEFGMMLQAKTHSVCVTSRENLKSVSQVSLNKVSFSYRSSQNELPKYCYYNSVENSCLNYNGIPKFGFSQYKRSVSDYFESNGVDTSGYLTLILDPMSSTQTDLISKIEYDHIQFSSYPLITNFTISTDQFNNGLGMSQINIDVPTQSKFIALIPKLSNSSTLKGIISQSVYKKNEVDHNPLLSGETSLIEKTEGKDKYLRLFSSNNFLNFWINLPEWDNGNSYIISAETRKINGMLPVINISSLNNKFKFVNTYMPAKDIFSKNHNIIGPNNQFDKGLQILFNSSSYNDTPTVFDIKDVSIYPFPYSFLSQLYLHKANLDPVIGNVLPSSAVKRNVTSYEVQLNQDKNSVLVLYQGYHEGWKAYETQNQISQVFPFLFGREIKNHVLVNNWANGWELSPGNHNIVIVFWPQYLEFIGFGLLIVTFIWTLLL